MRLHEDNEIFVDLIEETADKINLPAIYIEKDYWVTNALKYLSQSEYLNDVVFKGGTSLSKAYRLINRFSEDIDLAIIDNGMTDSGRKKKIKNVEKVVSTGLIGRANHPRESKGSKFRRTVYEYPKAFDGTDFSPASPEILLEINTFTTPEPNQFCKLSSFITQTLENFDRQDLIDKYELEGFEINVLSVQKTLSEKIIRCVKDSYSDTPVESMSKNIRHLYDITKILSNSQYRQFIMTNEFKELICFCIENEKTIGLDGAENLEKPIREAPLFTNFGEMRLSLERYYHDVFREMVYDDLPDMDDIEAALDLIRCQF